MFTIMKAAQVTCLDHVTVTGEIKLMLGDENGDIRTLDLMDVIKQLGIKPIPFEEIA